MTQILHCKSDTVYLYTWEMINKPRYVSISYIWYHKKGNIHLYKLQEGKVLDYRRIQAVNYAVLDTIDNYKTVYWKENAYGQCYVANLDGGSLYVYTRKQNPICVSFDWDCLKYKECNEKTFEYKLKYDFRKIIDALK